MQQRYPHEGTQEHDADDGAEVNCLRWKGRWKVSRHTPMNNNANRNVDALMMVVMLTEMIAMTIALKVLAPLAVLIGLTTVKSKDHGYAQ